VALVKGLEAEALFSSARHAGSKLGCAVAMTMASCSRLENSHIEHRAREGGSPMTISLEPLISAAQPWLVIILQVITLSAIVIAGLIIKDYMPSYAREKGKNLATKEDIGEITHKIEEIKKIYASDLQRIKAILDAQGQQYLHLYDKRSDALAQFFDDCSLLSSRLRTPIIFHMGDGVGLDTYIRETVGLIYRAISSEHRLKIYLPPGDIIDAANKMMDVLSDLHENWLDEVLSYRTDFSHAVEERESGRFNPPQNWSLSLESLRKFNTERAQRVDLALREYATALNGNLNSDSAEEFLSRAATLRFNNVRPPPEVHNARASG
jgi:hypothetical protein